MIFGLLFILAFLIGLVVYLVSNRWLVAVLVSTVLFVITTLADTEASEYWGITFIFGIPIVVVASILGAYVVELRRGIDEADSDEALNTESAEAGTAAQNSSNPDGRQVAQSHESDSVQ